MSRFFSYALEMDFSNRIFHKKFNYQESLSTFAGNQTV